MTPSRFTGTPGDGTRCLTCQRTFAEHIGSTLDCPTPKEDDCACSTTAQFAAAIQAVLHYLLHHVPAAVRADASGSPTGTTYLGMELIDISTGKTSRTAYPDIYIAWSEDNKAAFRRFYTEKFGNPEPIKFGTRKGDFN